MMADDAPCEADARETTDDRFSVVGQRAVIATMHGKERVISPLLSQELGLIIEVPSGFDTDRFGTFTREIERSGTQLDAARAKIRAAFEHAPHARVAIASEGSFGPHPAIPSLAIGRELVLLVNRETGLELRGHDGDLKTNFGHAVVDTPITALAFAGRKGFPEHGVIVTGSRGNQPAPDILIRKGIVTPDALDRAVREAVALCGAAFIETDMRAHVNPSRMSAIERATVDLIRKFRSRCPSCGYPGFDVTERIAGLPCEWCGEPTDVIKTEALTCTACGHRIERPATNQIRADPGNCESCNP